MDGIWPQADAKKAVLLVLGRILNLTKLPTSAGVHRVKSGHYFNLSSQAYAKEEIVSLRVLYVVLLLAGIAAADSFDRPLSKKTVALGRSPSRSGRRAKVNCYVYPTFMVKEVDLGEKGADRLAIIPVRRGVVQPCTRTRNRAEMVINPDEWTGYFKGAKGKLVFFDADDGWNGGMGFIIYDARTGKKVFEDSAVGDLDFLPPQAGQITLKYTRIIDSQCNAPKDEAACWTHIKKTIGVESPALPDCKKAYEESAQKLAKGRCEAQKSNTPQCVDKEIQLARDQTSQANSIIAYPVEVTLGQQPAIKGIPGDLKCWPSD